MTADLRALLDRLDTALAAATPGPWVADEVDEHRANVRARGTSDGWQRVRVATEIGQPDAALIVATVNALPGLLAAVRAVADLADELEEDSRDAMRISADGRERGDKEVHRINARHGRVAHHAASAIRGALTAALTEEDQA